MMLLATLGVIHALGFILFFLDGEFTSLTRLYNLCFVVAMMHIFKHLYAHTEGGEIARICSFIKYVIFTMIIYSLGITTVMFVV